jgi:hypothetical protein
VTVRAVRRNVRDIHGKSGNHFRFGMLAAQGRVALVAQGRDVEEIDADRQWKLRLESGAKRNSAFDSWMRSSKQGVLFRCVRSAGTDMWRSTAGNRLRQEKLRHESILGPGAVWQGSIDENSFKPKLLATGPIYLLTYRGRSTIVYNRRYVKFDSAA